MALNLPVGGRAQRKLLITVAEWFGVSHDVYTVTDSQPSDWASSYTNYYEKIDGQYTAVTGDSAPTWEADKYYAKSSTTTYREIMGTRTEDSSIEFNADIQTSTDILGITYTDVNKTEPQQTFDPMFVLGDSALSDYLVNAALDNDIDKYNGIFNVYVITAFIGSDEAYKCVKHKGCSIIPTSIGGDSYVSMPVEVHFSNNITKGTVDKLRNDFVFTPTAG